MRPIASNNNTLMERMAQMMLDIMDEYPIKHGLSVKNSIEFANRIKNIKLTINEKLVSFDVTALYPRVPV